MKIAITSKGKEWDSEIDPRFGRADYILMFDESDQKLEKIGRASCRERV